jgi:adenylylsulfate kinase
VTARRAGRGAARGAVAWITGLPASGKSTFGRALAARARAAGLAVALLDGDAVRAALGRPAGRGAAERDAFYAALARLAALLARQGLTVLVAATAPRRAHRALARRLAPAFAEIHVATPAEACARRDPKGLWAAARAGEAPGLPGAGAPFEPPRRPAVTARGGRDRAALRRALEALRGRRARGGPISGAATRPAAPARRARPRGSAAAGAGAS